MSKGSCPDLAISAVYLTEEYSRIREGEDHDECLQHGMLTRLCNTRVDNQLERPNNARQSTPGRPYETLILGSGNVGGSSALSAVFRAPVGTKYQVKREQWLRAAARDTLPAYEEKTDAVILLDEFETRVKESGEVVTVRRLAYKILRPTGREHAVFSVAFDSETNLTFLKTWSISGGREKEVKEKDAVETGFTGETLYSDLRRKIMAAPSSEVGDVVGYEYEQKKRPNVQQDI